MLKQGVFSASEHNLELLTPFLLLTLRIWQCYATPLTVIHARRLRSPPLFINRNCMTNQTLTSSQVRSAIVQRMERGDLSYRQAARQIGVNHSSLWRFVTGGGCRDGLYVRVVAWIATGAKGRE